MPLFTRRLAQSDPSHNLIAPNPRLVYFRVLRLLFLVLMFLLIFIIVGGELIALVILRETPFLGEMLIIPLILLLMSGLCTIFIQYLTRLEPLRFAAAQGDQHLLADDQPQPNTNSLSLPMTINSIPIFSLRYTVSFFWLGVLPIMVFIYFIAFSIMPWSYSLILSLFLGVLLLSYGVRSARRSHPIELTQEGIRSRSDTGQAVFMPWHEVRIFACYPEPAPWHNSPTTYCEISSARDVVSWTWTRRKSPLHLLPGSFTSLEEHNAQMQALCSLITAKTGLPLYDLGKGSVPVSSDSPSAYRELNDKHD